MLVLRLKPIGKKKQISFRVVVAEKHSKLNSRFVDDLGFYNPKTDKCEINADKAKYWLSKGVQPSDTIYNLFVTTKIIDGKKRAVKMKKAPVEVVADVPKQEVAPVQTPAENVEAGA
jgi:small subunit ribosomal protein S16